MKTSAAESIQTARTDATFMSVSVKSGMIFYAEHKSEQVSSSSSSSNICTCIIHSCRQH